MSNALSICPYHCSSKEGENLCNEPLVRVCDCKTILYHRKCVLRNIEDDKLICNECKHRFAVEGNYHTIKHFFWIRFYEKNSRNPQTFLHPVCHMILLIIWICLYLSNFEFMSFTLGNWGFRENTKKVFLVISTFLQLILWSIYLFYILILTKKLGPRMHVFITDWNSNRTVEYVAVPPIFRKSDVKWMKKEVIQPKQKSKSVEESSSSNSTIEMLPIPVPSSPMSTSRADDVYDIEHARYECSFNTFETGIRSSSTPKINNIREEEALKNVNEPIRFNMSVIQEDEESE